MKDKKRIVACINKFLMKELWFDFEVMQYTGNELIVMGSLDISSTHEIEVIFRDIFFVSLPMNWRTDTSAIVLEIVTGKKASVLNRRFQVEQGYSIFRFNAEYYPDDFGCLVAAKEIDYRINKPGFDGVAARKMGEISEKG